MDQIVIEEYGKHIDGIALEKFIHQYEKTSWIYYLIQPIIITIKLIFVTACLFYGFEIGKSLKKITVPKSMEKISFLRIFNFVMIAEFVFILSEILKIIYLASVPGRPSGLKDISYYKPLGIFDIIKVELLDNWEAQLLTNINVFEALYFFVLAYFFAKALELEFQKSFIVVSLSYGIGLIFWVLLSSGISFAFE